MSLASCLKEAAPWLYAGDPARINEAVARHRLQGKSATEAQLAAVDDFIAEATKEVQGFAEQGAAQRAADKRLTEAGKGAARQFAQFPGSQTTIGRWIQDALFNLREHPWALKWLTNDQIAEGFKHLAPVQAINRAMGRMGQVANRYLEDAAQIARRWRALDDEAVKSMQELMLETTMHQMHVVIPGAPKLSADEVWNHELNKHLSKEDPSVRVEFMKLRAKWDKLPAGAKANYERVRDFLKEQHDDMLDALRKSVADHYAAGLKRALTMDELLKLSRSDAGAKAALRDVMTVAATPQQLRALDGLYRALRDINREFGTMKGPYFPLVRFGSHVAVMKSTDLQALEDELAARRDVLQKAMDDSPGVADADYEGYTARLDALRAEYNEQLKLVEDSKKDEKNYVVEFHETPADAERAAKAMEKKHPGAKVYTSVREEYYRGLDGTTPAFLQEMQATLKRSLDAAEGLKPGAAQNAVNALREMYLRRTPERSALRGELKRMGIEGVKAGQMLRGFAQASRNNAWRISRLQHSGEITQSLLELSAQREDRDARYVLNELKARFVGEMTPPENEKVLRMAQNATYFMHLGFNISYFTTNATQAWLISLPVMAGRHGFLNASNSLAAASKDVIALLKSATVHSLDENGGWERGLQLRLTEEQIAKAARNKGEEEMLRRLTQDGVIDITLKHDLGAVSDGTTNSYPGRVMQFSSALANYPELYNRLATSLAAYRMEMAYGDNGRLTAEERQDKATEYAEYIINRTHFNYSPENAPRMMRGQLGRLVFQFKRYQQGMIYLYAKMIREATHGDKDSQRALAYVLGMTVASGGTASLPIAAPIALALKVLASAYPDDDEPQWLQSWYEGMKDAVGETAAQAMVKGLPTLGGLDLSTKLGHGNILNPIAFAKTEGKDMLSADWWATVTASLMGPAVSLVGRELEAAGAFMNGQYARGWELSMPTFIANWIKATRRETEGLTTKAGDTIMSPDEFNAIDFGLRAAGFESVRVTDTYDRRNAFLDATSNRQDARKRLLRDYYEAVRDSDAGAIAAAQQAIAEFNERQPADSVKSRDLQNSIRQHEQRSQQTQRGLRVTPRDRDTYNRVFGEDDGS